MNAAIEHVKAQKRGVQPSDYIDVLFWDAGVETLVNSEPGKNSPAAYRSLTGNLSK